MRTSLGKIYNKILGCFTRPTTEVKDTSRPELKNGGVCMKGSIHYRKDRDCYFVAWWDKASNKSVKIYRYKGELIYSEKIAEKLLALIQGDVENGTFRMEKYAKESWTDTVEYLWEWLESEKGSLTPAGYKDYNNSIKNHLVPFFTQHPYQLNEIQYDVLIKLLNWIKRSGKGKQNVMYCLHRCLKDARRSNRIPVMPEFPQRGKYMIQEPSISWLPSERQRAVLQAIPEEHQPIFWWLKYHLRRPAEAMALRVEDYDSEKDVFIVRRSISARQPIDMTKTQTEHVIPCHPDFKEFLKKMPAQKSHYFFTCDTSRTEGNPYTHRIMELLWRKACRETGENISMYAGLKHSSCSQYVNEAGMALSDLQILTDHSRYESVKKYAKVGMTRKRQLYEVGRGIRTGLTQQGQDTAPKHKVGQTAEIISFPKHSRKLAGKK